MNNRTWIKKPAWWISAWVLSLSATAGPLAAQSSKEEENIASTNAQRIVPEVLGPGKRVPLLIDSDVANEIDDLYAIALALAATDRFDLRGFVATHFAQWAGPESTEESYQLLRELLAAAGHKGRHRIAKGGHPMQYTGIPSKSEGAELIIELAREATPDQPLWIVVLGAATNTASALLIAPDIKPNVRVVFHARCAHLWPHRTVQFNVAGDVVAVQTLLKSGVPLVWFDTGTKLTIPYEETAKSLAPIGATGCFLHEFRNRKPQFASREKGFFDMGDIAWLMDPTLCTMEIVPAPLLRRHMEFDPKRTYGNMLRVTEIDVPRTWGLFFDTLNAARRKGIIQ